MSENHEAETAYGEDQDFTGAAITDEAINEFIEHGGGSEMPNFHPILHIWREVLSNAEGEITAKVTPQWANRITSSYRELNFADMENFRDSLFSKVMQLGQIVVDEIATDDECLNYSTPEEDVEHNSGHYRNILRDWQLAILGWELAWETTAPDAAVDLAAISEVHKMFFGPTGITAFLDNIKFEFTEADQAELAVALQEMKDGQ